MSSKDYFANYFLHRSDVTFDIAQNKMQVHQNGAEPWKVTLVDTGLETMTVGVLSERAPIWMPRIFASLMETGWRT